ncbi:polysaccharide deacetylase family protein [Flavobacterium sp. J372]|uniref:polysaccharide deacetylase family protein n=1 Tax=Flavobacterium sp. J372 TaxID=2898436 RepID=UPI0021514B65|nr:polysaccharide deacetylase family protein [Flavobacterium sp. J372]MCR5862143.1 polysaccharide deacetylase family protein [Flavobacterium sp. J372]
MAKLPVLMYHNVTPNEKEGAGLTISARLLEEHLRYIHDSGYTTLHLDQINTINSLPAKTLLITFDDVAESQLEYAVPLLEKYGLRAVFFIPFKYVGGNDDWNDGSVKIMSLEQLKSINPDVVQFAWHSYRHGHYKAMSEAEVIEDLDNCQRFIDESGLEVYPAIAYPFGSYPKKGEANAGFKEILQSRGLKMGFRIGNRVNRFPLKDKFEIQRIDIKGEDTLFKFRLKLKFGKLRLF